MEIKDKGNIALDKGNKKQVNCHRFKCQSINRELMIHEDIDTKGCISVSDCTTGLRLFKLRKGISEVQPSDITNELDKYIKHYTREGIVVELKRIEDLQNQEKSK